MRGTGQYRVAMLIVTCSLLAFNAFAWAKGATDLHHRDAVGVTADVQPFVKTNVRNPLRFDITGAVGKYDSVNAAEYTLEANVPVTVKLEASPLSYESDNSIFLDVVYWVNDETHSFRPGKPTSLNLPFARYDRYTLQLRGRVTIHGVADQPAGSYGGTVWVTVSAQH